MSKGYNCTGDTNANSMNTTPKQLDMPRVGVAGYDKISSKCSILQTASLYVCLQGRETKATLLFYSGAGRSYVSSALIKGTEVEGTSAHTCNITFAAFGVESLIIKGALCLTCMSRVPVAGSNHLSHFLQFRSTLYVRHCLKIMCLFPCYNHWGRWSGLIIIASRVMNKSVSIDILIGLDNYWRFIKSGIVHIAEGLVAQESVFGWVCRALAKLVLVVHCLISCSVCVIHLIQLLDLSGS